MGFLKSLVLVVVSVGVMLSVSKAQTVRPQLMQSIWKASWIDVPGEPAQGYGVYYFRKQLNLPKKPSSFVVHVSADNRYKLYVNETEVSLGPARGDIAQWYFETVDLAPFLKEGTNTLSAVVWNEGEYRMEAQISHRTAFILQGNTEAEEIANTNQSWKGIRAAGYQPLYPVLIRDYYAAGPGEAVDYRLLPDGWMQSSFTDTTAWKPARELMYGAPKGVFKFDEGSWMLVPRPIPQMEHTVQRLQQLRKADGITIQSGFPKEKTALTIPANSTVTLLLDQGHLINAYPTLHFSGGTGAQLSMAYAEALYIDEGNNKDWREQRQKGNRNEVDGKRFVGKKDSLVSNGRPRQQYAPLLWRTYRYLQLKVQTGATPLTIDDIYSQFTGYPFQFNAKFDAGNQLFQNIIDVGWRTARMCANETYMDCPYYEQLQYAGDTRIQALVSLYNSGDDRLMRHAITLLDQSRIAEGITMSRYPTANPQQIPPFSLWWIGMLHDYWMYRPDAEFVRQKLPGTRQVMQFFSHYQQEDGSLKNAPYWNFTDWSQGKGWKNGMAPVGKNGNSAALDLQLLWGYQIAAQLEQHLGMTAFAVQYKAAADKLKATIQKKYWNAAKGLFADTQEKEFYSQHVNALSILTGLVQGANATALAQKILADTSLTQATIYFKFYINQALVKAGLGNEYLNWLDIWKANLANGLTTWAEISDINNSRSDCHAWGSHPNIEFFRTVLGIDSHAPGFRTVKVKPHLGTLKNVSGEIPHPAGKIKAAYIVEGGKVHATITLPPGTNGTFVWMDKQYPLKAGVANKITVNSMGF